MGQSADTALGGALEAMPFSGWIYDHLEPLAQESKEAHPAMLKAIAGNAARETRAGGCHWICCASGSPL